MRRRPRTRHEPRLEMFPLMDVVFLLLCFFIYGQLVVPNTNTLPVDLTVAAAGVTSGDQLVAITIGPAGELYWNRDPVTMDTLRDQLAALALRDDTPPVYVAMSAESDGSDRGPVWSRVVGACYEAGVTRLTLVGDAGG